MAMKISIESRSLAMAMLLAAAAASKCQTPPQGTPSVIHVEGDVDGVHDPSIIKEADTWYLFGTVTEKISRASFRSGVRRTCTPGCVAALFSKAYPIGSKRKARKPRICGLRTS